MPAYTTFIPGTACIGDSRTTINSNFSALDIGLNSVTTSLSTASISLSTVSLSARFINIVHAPFNDGINPNLFIGEVGDGTTGSITGSLTGFNIFYDESNNRLNTTIQQGNVTLSAVTYTLNGNVGIGTTAPNRNLTVNGTISATGNASFSNQTYVDGNSVITGALGDARYDRRSASAITTSVFNQTNTNTLADLPSSSVSLSANVTYIVFGTVVSVNSTTGASGGVQIQLFTTNTVGNPHTFCNISVNGSVRGTTGNNRTTANSSGSLFNTPHLTSNSVANTEITNTFQGFLRPAVDCILRVTIAPINVTAETFTTKAGSGLTVLPIII